MKSQGDWKLILLCTASLSFLVGALVGGYLTNHFIVKFWIDNFTLASAASGDLAHTALVYMESGDLDSLRTRMEQEVDSTLELLDCQSSSESPAPGSPLSKIHERLASYRMSHPVDGHQDPLPESETPPITEPK